MTEGVVEGSSGEAGDPRRLRIALGSDHEGYRLKERLVMVLREDRHSVKDHGVHNADPCDYPEVASLLARALNAGDADVGILVCSSGAGASLAANKIRGIRAVHCQDTFSARQARRTLATNVLSIGSRVTGDDLAVELARAWLDTDFEANDRAERLLGQVDELEERFGAGREGTSAGRVGA